MLRDVFYYGKKPNVHPREQFAENLADARLKATTRDFWIINEFCDYRNFDWDFDFEFLPDEDVWAEDHNNVWPSQHQKDSGTWLCPKEHSDLIIYRGDVDPVIRRNEKTDHWVELDLINHNKFDFSWHPDPTDPPYIYKWPCKFFPAEFKHVLEYRVPGATQEKYMNTIAELVPEHERWVEHQAIDKDRFDMSWRPNPLDPPFTYVWGNKYIDGTLRPTLEYHTPGATDKKYMSELVPVLPETDRWNIVEDIDKSSFDFSWRPDPREPAFIYVFGNEQYEGTIMPTIEYHCPDATEIKYIEDIKAKLAPKRELFEHLEDSYGIDYTWRPDPTSPPYIYAWGNQWNIPEDKVSVQFVVEGATEYKYMEDRAVRKPCMDNWIVPDDVDTTGFDFSWEPSPAAPPYIYEFATQWQKTGGPQYVVPGATEKQYVDFQKVRKIPSVDKWNVPDNIDSTTFDFSWHPDDTSPPYIYVFATQWAFSGGPTYIVDDATEIKYVDDQIAIAKPDKTNWVYDEKLIDIESFDFSWHPYVEDQPYIYQFGTQWQKTGGPKYITPGADSSSPVKYIDTRIIKATRLPDKHNHCWVKHYSIKDFDYSWHPDDTEEPYTYVFGNTLYPAEEMPTIEYHVSGAKQIKFISDIVATLDVDMANWVITQPINEESFDFSWKPNPTDPPYIYRWGNKYISNKYKATVEYIVPGATDIKYMTDDVEVMPEWDRWEIPDNVDTAGFDFTWRPDPLEPDLIYEFATQWQKTGGPRYVVEGATETKYLDFQKAKILPNTDNWEVPDKVDATDFDFSWHPDATDPAYIYQFGTQWALTGGPRYAIDGATETKYVDVLVAKALPDRTNWVYDETEIDVEGFDFSWHPYVEDQPYIYQFGTQWQKTGGPKYITPGANSSSPIKYIDTRILKAQRLPNKNISNWIEHYPIKDFDYSWHPDNTEEPYNYVFASNWYSAEVMPVLEYKVPGATKIKYVGYPTATLVPDMTNWDVPKNIDASDFDFSWRPEPGSPSYVYEFATQWQKTGGPKYIMTGATETKYVDFQKARHLPQKNNWEVPSNIDVTDFDFSWHPDDTDPDFIYQFGTQWALSSGPKYVVNGATEVKYVDNPIAKALPDRTNWVYDENEIDVNSFDFSWHPYVEDQPYIYQFGTQHQKTGGPKYVTPGADSSSPIKYIDTRIIKAKRLPNRNKFKVLGGVKIKDFDWSWHPDDTSPPYIYLFGNNWYPADEMPTIEYRVDGAVKAKFIDDMIAKLAPNNNNWEVREDIDVTRFDFSWVPHPSAKPYIYQFGTSANPLDGPMYVVPGNEGEIINVPRVEIDVDDTIIEDEQIDIHEESTTEQLENVSSETVDMFFVDRGNPEAAARFEALKAKYGTQIQKTRYLNSWVDTINRCTNRATSELIWVLNSELDYSDFNFSYYPNPWQIKMVHVFGTQWSHWGTTFMINTETFREDTKYIKIIEHLSNLNFVKDIRATATKCSHDIVIIDHGNKETPNVVSILQNKAPDKTVTTTKYNNSYLDTLREVIKRQPEKKEHFIWVCSSVCDYTNFDFTYIIDPFSRDNLHVFPSGKQKFGDTFFIDVSNAREVISELDRLENFTKVNYNGTVKAERLQEPIIVISDDTHTNSIDKITDFPYATLITSDNVDIGKVDVEPMNLWSAETKNIYVTSTGSTRIVAPKEIKEHVKKELYEYPYIKRAPKLSLSNPLDIVFLSNGETGAEEHYEHLLNITKNLPNRVVRVDGVNGRAAAYHAAAEASNTPWMFTVFAKLKVSPKFDFNWQPDRMQSPKHYIFHAKNPVNGLVYGHQAMIAYNKKLTLANDGKGLDFTLDDEHEVVPLISGIAQYNTDEFSTWRTAFREVIKLRADDSEVSKERLDAWLNKAEGDFAQYSIKGALDADEYYDEVDGDFDQLKLSYEWVWLREKFDQI